MFMQVFYKLAFRKWDEQTQFIKPVNTCLCLDRGWNTYNLVAS